LKVIAELIRWIFIVAGSAVYVIFAYLASLDFRSNQGTSVPGGGWGWAAKIARHVVLVPGVLPLIVAIVWAWNARSPRTFGIGAAVVLGMLAYHYVLFAVSAHSDSAYPWFQTMEVVLFWFAIRFLLRTSHGAE
jgi:hypothetical protein